MMATMLSMTLLYPEWLAQLCHTFKAHQHETELYADKFAKCVQRTSCRSPSAKAFKACLVAE